MDQLTIADWIRIVEIIGKCILIGCYIPIILYLRKNR